MIKAINKHIACLPTRNGGITKPFSSSHNGTDWGWTTQPYTEVYPIQDGVVREVGYEGASSGIGYYVTVEHQYDDGTHSFSGYIHLKEAPKVKKGDLVEAGKTVLGIRGGSPYQNGKAMYGVHIHLYTTAPTTVGYSWNNMRKLATDPFKIYKFCKLKGVDYSMAVSDGHNFNNAPIYEDEIISDYAEIQQLKEQVARLSTDLANALSKLEEIRRLVA